MKTKGGKRLEKHENGRNYFLICRCQVVVTQIIFSFITDSTLPVETFHLSMVASVQHGPDAIDISETQDIFGISRSPEDSSLFIGHEFIIYLLKQALREEDAFRRFET